MRLIDASTGNRSPEHAAVRAAHKIATKSIVWIANANSGLRR